MQEFSNMMKNAKYRWEGIFDDEKTLFFVHILRNFTKVNIFDPLLKQINESYEPQEYAEKWRIGLGVVKGWDRSILENELSRLDLRYPQFRKLYRYVVLLYLHKTFEGLEDQNVEVEINLPPLRDFFHHFLGNLATLPEISSGGVFKMNDYKVTRTFIELVRKCLFQIVSNDVVYRPRQRTSTFSQYQPIPVQTNDHNGSDEENEDEDEDFLKRAGGRLDSNVKMIEINENDPLKIHSTEEEEDAEKNRERERAKEHAFRRLRQKEDLKL